MTGALWAILLALMAVVSAVSFYAGYRSARSYLSAAQAVLRLTNAVAEQNNSFGAALDKSTTQDALLRKSVEHLTEVVDARQRAVEDSILLVLQGLERSGIARSASRAPGRQVGEKGPE